MHFDQFHKLNNLIRKKCYHLLSHFSNKCIANESMQPSHVAYILSLSLNKIFAIGQWNNAQNPDWIVRFNWMEKKGNNAI